MRVLTSLSLGIVFGLLTACDAGGTDAQATAFQKAESLQSTSEAATPQAPAETKPTSVSDVPMPRQAAADADKATPLIHWDMRADESSIGFKGVQTGDAFTGEFKSFTADIVFVPQNLALSTVKAVIDMSSFEAGNKDRNEALPGKNWFAVKDFPQAVFTTDDFTGLGDNNYEAKGQLTIRDVSLPVTLPFNLDISEDGVARMSGTLDIDRSDYGVGQGAWAKGEWVDLTVGIDIEIIADKRP